MCLLRRVDDEFLDPLELRPDSHAGRARPAAGPARRQVVMANAPGSAFLESPRPAGFPAGVVAPSAWRRIAVAIAGDLVVRRTCRDGRSACRSLGKCLCHQVDLSDGSASDAGLSSRHWAGIDGAAANSTSGPVASLRQGDIHTTVQSYLPLSQIPTWQPGTHADDRPDRATFGHDCAYLRSADGKPQSWQVIPGGHGAGGPSPGRRHRRDATRRQQRRRAWVMTDVEKGERVDRTTLLAPAPDTSACVASSAGGW
jgi:hypothetical protein